ncbi:MAG: aldo/keto reductase, partial [Chloroflexi bacterium]|nr:aldo/keto reductase [Chloroflexota bacterium]
MDRFEKSEVGSTGIQVTKLGLGGAPLGDWPPVLSDVEAVETVRAALSHGMRYIDTAPHYGEGRSELRYGEALADVPRDSYVISTKVGRLLKIGGVEDVDFDGIDLETLPSDLIQVFDFSRDAVLRSFEDSLHRLKLDRIDILFLHDVPEEHYRTAIEEAFPVLADLRSQGVVGGIGAGLADLDLLLGFLRDGDFDCFLLPNRYTLTEQTAIAEFLPLCRERNISVILGAPYNQGRMLGHGKQTPGDLEHLRRYQTICDRYEVPIRAAALQFVVAHPSVVSVIPG